MPVITLKIPMYVQICHYSVAGMQHTYLTGLQQICNRPFLHVWVCIPHDHYYRSLVHETRKATVETILKQLKYVTKGHIVTQTILF